MTQILFDIAQASPNLPLSEIFPPAACLVFAIARFRPGWIVATTNAYWRLVTPILQGSPTNPIILLVLSFVPTLLGFLCAAPRVLIPGIILMGLFSASELHAYNNAKQTIADLRVAPTAQVIEGHVTRLDRYAETSMFFRTIRWHEILILNGKTFDYTEDEPGSPYPLTANWPRLKAGTLLRISIAKGKIVLVELPA